MPRPEPPSDRAGLARQRAELLAARSQLVAAVADQIAEMLAEGSLTAGEIRDYVPDEAMPAVLGHLSHHPILAGPQAEPAERTERTERTERAGQPTLAGSDDGAGYGRVEDWLYAQLVAGHLTAEQAQAILPSHQPTDPAASIASGTGPEPTATATDEWSP